jgi:hypothetical protein
MHNLGHPAFRGKQVEMQEFALIPLQQVASVAEELPHSLELSVRLASSIRNISVDRASNSQNPNEAPVCWTILPVQPVKVWRV